MPDLELTVERALSGPSATRDSFRSEQREHLWQRSRLLFLTGLAVSLISLALALLLPSADPALVSALSRWKWVGESGHAVSFLIGLGLLYVCRRRHRALHVVVFAAIAVNLVLVVYNQVAHHPATDPYFGVSVLFFLPAAFIPWRARYQVALAATAVAAFVLLHGLLQLSLAEVQAFWVARGGAEAARAHVTWGVTGIALLGGTSAFVSHTLYSLRKTAHRARRLGNYLIHHEIGKGGMGQVLFAQHSLICRPTAVKVMRATDGDHATALARFEREIKLSATLTHPNTITIYEVGRTRDRSLYYAMEYLEGLDLQQLVERFGPVPPARTIHILRQVCGSLEEAHSRDFIHRDIKPSNIFLTRRGLIYDFVKVLDFGLAKEIRSEQASAISKSGLVFGTPGYIAPETVYGDDEIDERADLYCLGGVAYWLLTGRPPFTSRSSVELLVDHVKTVPARPSEVSELDLPRELDGILMRLLEKKPDDRFPTARALDEALAAVPVDAWTRDQAQDWWSLHGILGDHPHDCECFFPEEEPAARGANGEKEVLAVETASRATAVDRA